MAATWDPEMVERLERVEQKIDGLQARFDRLEARFDGLETRFDGLEMRIDGLETRFERLETRFERLETRFDGLQVEVEHIRDDVRKLAGGQDALSKQIGREVADAIKPVMDLLAAHDLAIRDHGTRIAKLERRAGRS
jgi:chromosome segregation ATPase